MQPSSHWIKEIRRPVRPPTLFTTPEIAVPVRLNVELAEDVTRERPAEAFEVALAAPSLAFEAPEETVSVVEEACLTGVRRIVNRQGCEMTRAELVAIFAAIVKASSTGLKECNGDLHWSREISEKLVRNRRALQFRI